MENSLVKVCLIFPYSGYEKDSERESLWWKSISLIKEFDPFPTVVLNEDTKARGGADAFLADKRNDPSSIDVIKVWAVDTCQMWLHGWGHIFDQYPDADRIVQIPGDLDVIENENEFIKNLQIFISHPGFDILIGDFRLGDKFGAKSLIDKYGTYPLLSNWFPKFTQGIIKKSIVRPRSEFLNMNARILRDLLRHRKFAYEQTINLLIGAWDFKKDEWRYKVSAFMLGKIKDDSSQRNYLVALDQIERTERMLKLRWREIYQPKGHDNYEKFYKFYNSLDRLSTAVREASGITIQALLGLSVAAPPSNSSDQD